jgi:hypothetical protein
VPRSPARHCDARAPGRGRYQGFDKKQHPSGRLRIGYQALDRSPGLVLLRRHQSIPAGVRAYR